MAVGGAGRRRSRKRGMVAGGGTPGRSMTNLIIFVHNPGRGRTWMEVGRSYRFHFPSELARFTACLISISSKSDRHRTASPPYRSELPHGSFEGIQTPCAGQTKPRSPLGRKRMSVEGPRAESRVPQSRRRNGSRRLVTQRGAVVFSHLSMDSAGLSYPPSKFRFHSSLNFSHDSEGTLLDHPNTPPLLKLKEFGLSSDAFRRQKLADHGPAVDVCLVRV